MSTPGRRRSAAETLVPGGGGAAMRGALLIALAVVLGIALLANSFDTDGGADAAGGDGNGTLGDGDGGGDDDGGSDDTTPEVTTPSTHVPAEVKVWVLNGGGPQGAARTGTDRLIPLGYTTNSPENADPDVASSVVYAVAGYEGDAASIATALGLAATAVQAMPATPPVPNGDLQASQVLVILGPDFQIEATGTTVAGATSSTATGN